MRRFLAAVVGLALTMGSALAEPARLTPDQMRSFGNEALLRGFADQALGVAAALLQRDPADSLALTLRAQALRMKGELKASEAAARAAWAAADNAAERYSAATALAQALSLQDSRTRAQYWLRQAFQNAPNAAAAAQARADFDYVRRENPLSLQVSGSVRPSDNVNGGGTVEYIRIGPFVLPLPSTLIALSGTSWSFGAQGAYRLADDGQAQTALTFGANVQGVVLSDEAHAKAPELQNGDFLYGLAQLGLQRRADLGFGRLEGQVSAGHSWYGGRDLANVLTAELALERPLGPDMDLRLGASVMRQARVDDARASSTTYGLEAMLSRQLTGGDRIDATLDVAQVRSPTRGTAREEAGLRLEWRRGKPVAGLQLGASLSLRAARYENGREDRRHAIGLQATMLKASYLGFAPVISLDVTRNKSTVPWFSADTTALGFSLKSRF